MILNILESIEKILLYSIDCSGAKELYEINEQLNFNATLNLFSNVGENAGKVSGELKQLYPEIEWKL